MLFSAEAPGIGREPHFLDPATGDVALLTDLRAGAEGSISWPEAAFELAGVAYFAADDGTHGRELWRSEGSAGTTELVVDAVAGSGSLFLWLPWLGEPGHLADGRAVFTLLDPDLGLALWVSDGTTAGTHPLVDLDAQTSALVDCLRSRCTQIVETPRAVFFPAFSPTQAGFALGRADGTGLTAVEPELGGAAWSVRFPFFGYDLAAWANGWLFFPAGIDFTDDQAWISDGTAGGSFPLADVAPSVPPEQPTQIVEHGGTAFIEWISHAVPASVELWRSDGTGPGTSEVGAYRIALAHVAAPVAGLFLQPLDGGSLWEVEQPYEPPILLAELDGFVADVVAERPAGAAGERRLFLAGASGGGAPALWSWTAGEGLTLLAEGFSPVPGPTFASQAAPPVAFVGQRLVFGRETAEGGGEPWVTDGTPAGTLPLGDLAPGPAFAEPSWLTPLGGQVAFVATTPDRGQEIWITDGTPAGTHVAVDLVAGPGSSQPRWLAAVEDTLYFAATTAATGVEIWSWQPGSGIPPSLVADLLPGPGSSSPAHLTSALGRLFFTATDGVHGFELWSLPAGELIFHDGFESGALWFWESGTD